MGAPKKRHALAGLLIAAAACGAVGSYAAYVTVVEPRAVLETDRNDAFAVSDGWLYAARTDGDRLALVGRRLDGGDERPLATAPGTWVHTVSAGYGWVIWSWAGDGARPIPGVMGAAVKAVGHTQAVEASSGQTVLLLRDPVHHAAVGPRHFYLVDAGLLKRVSTSAPSATTALEPAVAVAADDAHVYALRPTELSRWRHDEDRSEIVATGLSCASEVVLGGGRAYVFGDCPGRPDSIVEVDPDRGTSRAVFAVDEPRHAAWVDGRLVVGHWHAPNYELLAWRPATGDLSPIDDRASVGPLAGYDSFVLAAYRADRIARFFVAD